MPRDECRPYGPFKTAERGVGSVPKGTTLMVDKPPVVKPRDNSRRTPGRKTLIKASAMKIEVKPYVGTLIL